jgi:hypothetical protein
MPHAITAEQPTPLDEKNQEVLHLESDVKGPDGTDNDRDIVDNGPSYTEQESKRVRLKLDAILLPVLCFLNLCSFLDKANIGNADVAGMSKDLKFSTAQFNFLLTIFYVVYTLSQWEFILLK